MNRGKLADILAGVLLSASSLVLAIILAQLIMPPHWMIVSEWRAWILYTELVLVVIGLILGIRIIWVAMKSLK